MRSRPRWGWRALGHGRDDVGGASMGSGALPALGADGLCTPDAFFFFRGPVSETWIWLST